MNLKLALRLAQEQIEAKDAEIERLRPDAELGREAAAIWDRLVAIRRPNGKPLSAFFFGQRLRREVREALDRRRAAPGTGGR